MSKFDFLVIYLTCGAPLGVFYFLRNYRKQKGFPIWLKTFLTFIFWLPFGFRLLGNILSKKLIDSRQISTQNLRELKFSAFQKQFETVLQQSGLPVSIFEFREVFERYVELTVAKRENTRICNSEREVFHIVGNENAEIGSICLNRRNLERLVFHQNKARQDFFQIISQLMTATFDKAIFANSVIDFFRLLNDFEAESLFGNFKSGEELDRTDFIVSYSDYFLWNTETHKPRQAKSEAQQVITLTTATNLSVKD